MRPLSALTRGDVPEKPLLTDQTSRSPKFLLAEDISCRDFTSRNKIERGAFRFMSRMKADIPTPAQRGVPAQRPAVRARFGKIGRRTRRPGDRRRYRYR